MKYILEISDSFYARDNECKHSLSSRLTKEFFEKQVVSALTLTLILQPQTEVDKGDFCPAVAASQMF